MSDCENKGVWVKVNLDGPIFASWRPKAKLDIWIKVRVKNVM